MSAEELGDDVYWQRLVRDVWEIFKREAVCLSVVGRLPCELPATLGTLGVLRAELPHGPLRVPLLFAIGHSWWYGTEACRRVTAAQNAVCSYRHSLTICYFKKRPNTRAI